MTKNCTKCGELRPISDFHKRRNRPRGASRCKVCRYEYGKSWVAKNRQRVNARVRQYYNENRQSRIEYSRKWRALNPDKRKVQHRLEHAKRKLDPECRMIALLRRRISLALKHKWKHGRTIELLGCSIPDFRIYLESKFETGMSWENYGRTGWHIDHIMPCAIFDLSKPEHQKLCFHFSNMQPMWARENLIKGKNVINHNSI